MSVQGDPPPTLPGDPPSLGDDSNEHSQRDLDFPPAAAQAASLSVKRSMYGLYKVRASRPWSALCYSPNAGTHSPLQPQVDPALLKKVVEEKAGAASASPATAQPEVKSSVPSAPAAPAAPGSGPNNTDYDAPLLLKQKSTAQYGVYVQVAVSAWMCQGRSKPMKGPV